MNDIREQEFLRQDEVDLRKVFIRFFRSWPIVLISVGAALLLGLLFLNLYPPKYLAKTSYLIEKPHGVNDPGTLVSELIPTKPVDDSYYKNQKIGFNTYPLVKRTVENLGLRLQYFQKGIFDKELYKSSPLKVIVEDQCFDYTRDLIPYDTPFYVTFLSEDEFLIQADGEYPITKFPFVMESKHKFGEWISADNLKFKVLKDSLFFERSPIADEIFNEVFGFKLKYVDALTLSLMSDIKVIQAESDASVIEVSLQAGTAEKAIDILAVLGDLYVEDHLQVKTEVIKKAQSFLDDEIGRNISELIGIESEIQTFKVQNESARMDDLGLLKNQESLDLENKKVAYMLKERYYEYLNKYLTENQLYTDLISPNAFGLRDPLITELTSNLVNLCQEATAMESSGTTANPLYAQLRANIASERNTILRTVEGFQESNRIASEDIDMRLGSLEGELRDLPRVQKELQRMERMYRINESLYQDLQRKRSTVGLSLASVTPDVRLIEPPYLTSLKPVFPSPNISMLTALLLGLSLPIVFVISKMLFGNSINEEEDLQKFIPELAISGAISNTTIRNTADILKFPNSRLAQQLGIILYGLENKFDAPKVVAITSSKTNEGKSFLTSLIGMKCGQMEQKVLIIDCNVRDPKLHKYLGLENDRGVADFIKGESILAELVKETSHEKVHFLCAGSDSKNVNLKPDKFEELIRKAKEKYGRIIIDTAPVGLIAETIELLNRADHTLIVSRRSRTSLDDLQHLGELIRDGLLPHSSMLITDVFDPGTKINMFKKWNKYQQERGAGLFGSISRLFKRI